jgi:hypothetical protein
MTNETKQFMEEYQSMLNFAELKSLCNHSLEHPLTSEQYNRVMELKKEVFK